MSFSDVMSGLEREGDKVALFYIYNILSDEGIEVDVSFYRNKVKSMFVYDE